MTDRSRLEKILGMLGSAYDGERAAAAAMIFKMAQSEKMTIAELCMGPPPGSSDYWRQQYNAMRQKFDRLQLEVNELKQKLERSNPASHKYDFNGHQHYSSAQQQRAKKLHDLAIAMHDQQSPLLNTWEKNFLENMKGWSDPYLLSDKQLYTIQKIHAKVSAAI
jgi:hypothetical protein